jgi:hypothetical protein
VTATDQPQGLSAEPTGLDYQAAYAAMYPGLQGQIRLSETNDAVLKAVDRAARLRRTERERVKAEFHRLLATLDHVEIALGGLDYVRAEMIKLSEEIR